MTCESDVPRRCLLRKWEVNFDVFEPIRAKVGRPTLQCFVALTSEGPSKSTITQLPLPRHTRRRSSHQHHRALDQQSCAPSTPKSISNRLKLRNNYERFCMRHFPGPSQTQPHQPRFSVLSAAQPVLTTQMLVFHNLRVARRHCAIPITLRCRRGKKGRFAGRDNGGITLDNPNCSVALGSTLLS